MQSTAQAVGKHTKRKQAPKERKKPPRRTKLRTTNDNLERNSFDPSGLVLCLPVCPRLAPWAAFFRRFAADLGGVDDRQPTSCGGVKYLFAISQFSKGFPHG